MIVIYIVALLVALLVDLLLSTASFALRLGLTLVIFCLLVAVATKWFTKIGDRATLDATTVIPLSMGTQVEFPVDLLSQQFTTSTYIEGKASQETIVKKGDVEYDALKKLFSQETQGWQYDPTTYAPKHVYDSPTMGINCLESSVIVNYKDRDARWIQISKQLPRGFCPG